MARAVRYIALLYSIVLTAERRVVMAEWRAMMEAMGLANPRTLIATGNAVFDCAKMPVGRLEARLADAFLARFGKRIHTIVRSAEDWRRLAAANPFAREAAKDGTKVFARVGRGAIDAAEIKRLSALRVEGEALKQIGHDLWVRFPGASATSRLVSAIARLREPVGTLRNWNTVRRIDAMLDGETP